MSEGKNRSSLNADDRIQLRRNVIHLYVRKTADGKQPTDKLLEPGQSLFTPTGYSLNRYSARSSSISTFEPFTNCNSCPRPASISYAVFCLKKKRKKHSDRRCSHQTLCSKQRSGS